MSSCLIITNGTESFVAADSAVVNDKKERIGEFAKKFYIFNNYSMFCSGDVSEVDEIVSFCESYEVEQPIEEISDYIIKSNMMAIEVVVFINQDIYSINKTNLYSPTKLSTTNGNISIFACGIKTREISNTASDVYVKTKDIYQTIHETYKINECNEIGGKISIYKVSNGKSNYVKGFFLNHKKESFIVGEVIVGRVFLGSNLYLETEDNSLRWDSNGLQLRNANIIITNDEGKEEPLETTLANVENKASKNLSDAMRTINQELTDLQYTITDGMSTIWYQDTEPSGANAGDTWYDTSSKNKAYLARKGGTPSRVGEHLLCGTFYVAKDIEWLPLQDESILDALSAAQSAQATADGKIKTYYQISMPSDGSYGDLWFDTDEGNKPYRHNGMTFIAIQDKAIESAQNTANSAITKVSGIITSNGLVDTAKMEGFIQAGNNNILLGASTNRMKLSENGILITKNDGASWDTAISAYGIVADAIQAGGTIQGCQFKAGEMSNGSYMDISSTGELTGYNNNIRSYYLYHKPSGSLTLYDTTTIYSGDRYEKIGIAFGQNEYGYKMPGITTLSTYGLAIGFQGTGKNLYVGGNIICSGYIDATNMTSLSTMSVSGLNVIGDMSATGEKDAIIPTQHYGIRTLYCTEADKAYFTTDGNSETLNGEKRVDLDAIFIEAIEVNSSYPYIIHLTSYSDAKVWVEQIDDCGFVVKSDKDTKFSYTLKAIRISFGNKYLEEKTDILSKAQLKNIQERAIQRMSG